MERNVAKRNCNTLFAWYNLGQDISWREVEEKEDITSDLVWQSRYILQYWANGSSRIIQIIDEVEGKLK